jgi:antitoxin component of MazEF toxin-antitoxin module
MLKKLVRYGNSNALVLDKAILELLNIAEGSVVKISTDGKSIILTPHQSEVSSKVIETVTAHDAMLVASVQETMQNYYKNLSSQQKIEFGAELLALTKKHSELSISLGYNEQLQKEFADARAVCAGDQAAFMVQYKKLIAEYVPEIPVLEQAMLALHEKCNSLCGNNPIQNILEQQKLMEKDMAEVFAKYKNTQMSAGALLSSPEYQHRAQLITEKYQGNQNSAEFMAEIKQLMYEFCPEMEQLHKDLEIVSKKYNQVNA